MFNIVSTFFLDVFSQKWFFDKFYNEFINQPILSFSYHISYKAIDRGVIEMLGPFGLSKAVKKKSSIGSYLHTGSVYDYALWMFIGFLSLLISLNYSHMVFNFIASPSLVLIFFFTLFFISLD